MPTAEILRTARAKIAEPSAWTKGSWARDINGRSIPPTSDETTCFCAASALDMTACLPALHFEALGLLKSCVPIRFYHNVVFFNDHPDTTHADVLALYDRAIEKAERKIGG